MAKNPFKQPNANQAISDAYDAVNTNPPKVLQQTAAQDPLKAKKQKIAIALSKARKAGAVIKKPSMKPNLK